MLLTVLMLCMDVFSVTYSVDVVYGCVQCCDVCP